MTTPESGNPWDDLFADLGLPAEAPRAAKAEAQPPAEEIRAEAAPAAEPPAARGRRRRSHAPAADLEETPPAPEAEAPAPVPAAPADAAAPPAEPGEAEPGAEEAAGPKGRSRRRRRGRGAKSAGAANAAPAADEARPEPAAAEGPAAEAEDAAPPAKPPDGVDERPRRRGGRSRGRKVERDEEPRADEECEERPVEIQGEEPEPATADEVDDLSNLNVPTWAELIASLYRPER
jgi:ribonuclease E